MKITTDCEEHGKDVRGYRGSDGRDRCSLCMNGYVARRARKVRALLVKEFGGKCAKCGFDRHVAPLQFHHKDPTTRIFSVGTGTRGIKKQREEAKKCILLCANCHIEEHWDLRAAGTRQDGSKTFNLV